MKAKKTRQIITAAIITAAALGVHSVQTYAEGSIAIDYNTSIAKELVVDGPNITENQLGLEQFASEDISNRLTAWTATGNSILTEENSKIRFTGDWQDARVQLSNKSNPAPGKYLLIPYGTKTWTNTYWTITDVTNTYTVKVELLETTSLVPSSGMDASNNPIYKDQPFIVGTGTNWFGSHDLYAPDCVEAIKDSNNNNKPAKYVDGTLTRCTPTYNFVYKKTALEENGLFVKLKYTIYRKPRRVYLYLHDIDNGQSYRIENQNICEKVSGKDQCKIFVRTTDAEEFSVNTASNNQKNYAYYDEDNITIFSSLKNAASESSSSELFQSNDNANVFIQLTDDYNVNNTEEITVTYGFKTKSASSWGFYSEEYNIEYVADNGKELSKSTDKIYASEHITEVPAPADSNLFTIEYWTVDKDVVLSDGTTYKAGTKLTAEQVRAFVVEDDYVLTAHMKEIKVNVPNTGDGSDQSIVGKVIKNTGAISLAILGILGTVIAAIVIRFYKHRKLMKF